MDALDFFLIRHRELRGERGIVADLRAGLTDDQWRRRPQPGVNTIAWLLWHTARVEDVGVNAFIAGRPQVLHAGGWLETMKTARRDVGTGMTDADVDALSAALDLDGLRGYWEAVGRATLDVVESLRGHAIDDIVPAERVRQAAAADGVVAANAGWLTDFWAKGRTRAWMLTQTASLHPYGHYFEARVVKGLWGHPSP
ncbi:MAG: DinB family protein [Candidatus Rokubacteria bacterium]|nr:DinB family protein [Candidatus Rokubacteria bacterium]